MVKTSTPALDENVQWSEEGIRLFSQAPPGIIFDPIGMCISSSPTILPCEKSLFLMAYNSGGMKVMA